MNKNQREQEVSQQEKSRANGLAQDADVKASSRVEEMTGLNRKEVRGAAFLLGGILLFIYSLGFFPFLNWLVMAGGALVALYGGKLLNLGQKARQAVDYVKNMWDQRNKK